MAEKKQIPRQECQFRSPATELMSLWLLTLSPSLLFLVAFAFSYTSAAPFCISEQKTVKTRLSWNPCGRRLETQLGVPAFGRPRVAVDRTTTEADATSNRATTV